MRTLTLLLVGAIGSAICYAQPAPDPDKGNEVFDEQCGACHQAYSEERKVGPGLKFLYARLKPEAIIDRIDKGGKGMPPFKSTLSAQDKADLLAYLKTL